MEEETKETKETKEKEISTEGDLISKATETAKRLEDANKNTEELLARTEKIEARKILGGQTEAGSMEEEEKEIPAEQYAKEVLEGQHGSPKQ